MEVLSVCFKCVDRKPNCHSECEKYKEEKANTKAIKEKISNTTMVGYYRDRNTRLANQRRSRYTKDRYFG